MSAGLTATIDALIPGDPAPSALGVPDLVARELSEAELQLAAALPPAELERVQPELFERIYRLVIHGYYAHPEVVARLAREWDFHGPPQPRGYADAVEPWNLALLNHGCGGYTPTDAVVPIHDDARQG